MIELLFTKRAKIVVAHGKRQIQIEKLEIVSMEGRTEQKKGERNMYVCGMVT